MIIFGINRKFNLHKNIYFLSFQNRNSTMISRFAENQRSIDFIFFQILHSVINVFIIGLWQVLRQRLTSSLYSELFIQHVS